jgi:hypothetical protein
MEESVMSKTDIGEKLVTHARFTSSQAVSLEEAFDLFYFEIYWD